MPDRLLKTNANNVEQIKTPMDTTAGKTKYQRNKLSNYRNCWIEKNQRNKLFNYSQANNVIFRIFTFSKQEKFEH